MPLWGLAPWSSLPNMHTEGKPPIQPGLEPELCGQNGQQQHWLHCPEGLEHNWEARAGSGDSDVAPSLPPASPSSS